MQAVSLKIPLMTDGFRQVLLQTPGLLSRRFVFQNMMQITVWNHDARH
jgi:hypothetical protein